MYYLPIRVMIPLSQPNGGTFMDIWQEIDNGQVVRHVSIEGLELTLPPRFESFVIDPTPYFAPGVVHDPAGYLPPTIEQFKAELAKSAEAVAKGDPETYSAWVSAEYQKQADIRDKAEAAAAVKG